ncbi:MAG TPA: tetratricopeptide repeat protein [Phormidium sp.]
MINQVAAAFDRKDYREAARLVKLVLKESPQNPWAHLYAARLHEVTGKLEKAETIYRQLLRDTTNPKIVTQARQGLQNIEKTRQEKRREDIAKAKADPSDTELGVLILEPVTSEAKQQAAQNFAQIMNIDPYSARLKLQSRGWRLLRTGAIGELRFYGQQLLNAQIPCFWIKLADIEKINIFRVSYFQSIYPHPTIVCNNQQGQLGSLTFNWREVSQLVQGQLPIFEEVVDLDFRKRLQRKVQTQDYAQFCDLHLPERNCILRLWDSNYQFQQGITFVPDPEQATTRINWNGLLDFLSHQLPQAKVWSDFTAFAETVLDHTELLNRIPSHISLFRREATHWDPAFQLYSSLVFLKHLPTTTTG